MNLTETPASVRAATAVDGTRSTAAMLGTSVAPLGPLGAPWLETALSAPMAAAESPALAALLASVKLASGTAAVGLAEALGLGGVGTVVDFAALAAAVANAVVAIVGFLDTAVDGAGFAAAMAFAEATGTNDAVAIRGIAELPTGAPRSDGGFLDGHHGCAINGIGIEFHVPVD
ncbi:Aste57867_5147 [Aphanomyces stellatus]|uniref:Aste57867_5147 protein n=1 Tax=Aphanomyces stellatus TaxID=120398 RepID=A0A485KD16_9STRA|nr:hypothetical protein As57867_005134 [Aphanomyces stellatus]VFT82225.1 Aste57867_5147 [Aphanomyces stellatus]